MWTAYKSILTLLICLSTTCQYSGSPVSISPVYRKDLPLKIFHVILYIYLLCWARYFPWFRKPNYIFHSHIFPALISIKVSNFHCLAAIFTHLTVLYRVYHNVSPWRALYNTSNKKPNLIKTIWFLIQLLTHDWFIWKSLIKNFNFSLSQEDIQVEAWFGVWRIIDWANNQH